MTEQCDASSVYRSLHDFETIWSCFQSLHNIHGNAAGWPRFRKQSPQFTSRLPLTKKKNGGICDLSNVLLFLFIFVEKDFAIYSNNLEKLDLEGTKYFLEFKCKRIRYIFSIFKLLRAASDAKSTEMRWRIWCFSPMWNLPLKKC